MHCHWWETQPDFGRKHQIGGYQVKGSKEK
jgi:hypothetical protein